MSPVESVQVTLADRGDLAAMLALSNESAARSVANFATAPEPLDEWVEAFERASAAYPWLVVGTFEFFATRGDHEAIAALATYALQRHYPDAVDTGNDALALLERVIDAQATLVARWLGVALGHRRGHSSRRLRALRDAREGPRVSVRRAAGVRLPEPAARA
jgi:hypothetical protein